MKTICVLAFFVLVACSIGSAEVSKACKKCITNHKAEARAAGQDKDKMCAVKKKMYACGVENECSNDDGLRQIRDKAKKENCTLSATKQTKDLEPCIICLRDFTDELPAAGKDKYKRCAVANKYFSCEVKAKCLDSDEQKKAIDNAKKKNCKLGPAWWAQQAKDLKACNKCRSDHSSELKAAGKNKDKQCAVAKKVYECGVKAKCLHSDGREKAQDEAKKINCKLGAAGVTAQVSMIVASVLFVKLVNVF